MSQHPASNILRGAGWCLLLLLLASLGGVSPSAAMPQPVASSSYARPVGVLQQVSRPDSVPVPTSTPAPPPPPQRYADAEAAAAIVTLTNDLRAQHGLSPLTADGALAAAAQAYAETMATNDWLAHDGPDGSTLSSRAQAAGYNGWSYLMENLYRGFYGDSSANIIQVWVTSPAHLNALLSDLAMEIGVGCYVSGDYRWCVQEFGAR